MSQRTKKQKIELTDELRKWLENSNVVYLADFTGLNVKSMTELRKRFRESDGRFVVVKNRLALRALEQLEFPDIKQHLRGPTGFVLGVDDPVTPAKTLREFAKENEDRPSLKIGVVERRIVSVEEIERLAELPPRQQLLGGIAGSMMGPVTGIVGVLNALMRDLAYMIGEVAKKNEGAPEGS